VGVIGRYSRKVANDLARKADVVLVIGCRLGGLVTDTYSVPSPDAQIIHIDVDTGVLGTTYRETVSIQADALLALQALHRAAEGRKPPEAWGAWADEVRQAVAAWRRTVDRVANRPPGQPLHPAAVVQALGRMLQPEDIVVADTGYMGAWTGACYPVRAPGRHYIRAAGSLGWALPAAMGAQLARPQRRVVCVSGDGGMGYHIGELETALRCRIPVVVVVLNNRSLAFEYHEQKYNWQNQIVAEVNDFVDVDYGAVARAFGARGSRVETLEQFAQALEEALRDAAPTVIDVLVDKEVHGPVTVFESVLARDI
jgi:acetolactate synthase-1/2/3 large subunit